MRLSGHLTVPMPPPDAFRLFTATGERAWVPGWEPHFPAPVADDAAVGVVFRTSGDGHDVTWIVVDRDGDRRIRYARVAAGRDAGTVEVTLEPAGAHTDVTVTYDVTPLGEPGQRWLTGFAAGYPDFLRSWEEAIRRYVRAA